VLTWRSRDISHFGVWEAFFFSEARHCHLGRQAVAAAFSRLGAHDHSSITSQEMLALERPEMLSAFFGPDHNAGGRKYSSRPSYFGGFAGRKAHRSGIPTSTAQWAGPSLGCLLFRPNNVGERWR